MKKTMSILVLICLSNFLLTGCVANTVKEIPLVNKFDANQATKLLKPGRNTIEVNGFLRQAGGGVVTCAGAKTSLTPATAMARERIGHLYGSDQGGFNSSTKYRFTNTDPAYDSLQKTAICNSEGKVVFKNVADGDFYVVTMVVWTVPVNAYYSSAEGGALSQLVSVRGGETKSIILTNSLK
jgi:hypothetical protein